MPHAQYFDSRSGRQLSEDEALDHNGVIKSGVILRTPMSARDAGLPRFTNDAGPLRLVDGYGNADPLALRRAGFRQLVGGDSFDLRDAKRAAYQDYIDRMSRVWRADAAEEEDDDDVLDAATTKHNENDRRSVADIARDRRRNMDRLYAEYEREQSNAWRNK
jgi:hypothetical protein